MSTSSRSIRPAMPSRPAGATAGYAATGSLPAGCCRAGRAPPGPNGAKGKRQANPLSALSLWKLFDILRRSLVAPALLALLAGGWLLGPAWVWTLLGVAGGCLPPPLSAGVE